MSAQAWAEYEAPAHKLLSDQRLDYFAQSAATHGGTVAPFPCRLGGDSNPIPAFPSGRLPFECEETA